MREALAFIGFAAGCLILAYGWRRTSLRRKARQRLGIRVVSERAPIIARAPNVPITRANYVLPWAFAALLGLTLHYFVGLHFAFAGMFGLLAGLLGSLLEAMRVQRRMALIEKQLSDSIDIVVGALRAGSSVSDALSNAMAEARAPLRTELHELLHRLRLGDDPTAVFQGLTHRVPLETFSLFSSTLIAHWEVGGNLAPPLASVGRTIRDRIEIARRIRSLTTQSRVSTIAILAATYFIAAIIWRNDPERMQEFLATSVGRWLVVSAVTLQGVGVVWSAWLGRLKF